MLGTYRREPVLNPWHVGDIQLVGPQLQWRNTAPGSWNLSDDLGHGKLPTGPDCPYYGSFTGQQFDIILERDAAGDLTDQVRGFGFVSEFYRRE